MGSCVRPALAVVAVSAAVLATLFVGPSAHAQGTATQGNLVDRVFVRYVSPETGGGARPRFLTEHEAALFARIEALIEDGGVNGDFLDRFGRVAVDRVIAEDMLAALQVEGGIEPPELPKLTREARETLEARVGGADALATALKAEGISDLELETVMRRRARATYYADRSLAPIIKPPEEELYNAFRTLTHPYRTMKYEDARQRFARWYAYERLRTLEIDFVQSARSRLLVTYL
ncbi:MAG: hypothetical protein HOO96_36395 [Polyangiaceae bacterium]|nr:hypothetical protein [Polyangiaceae bacterium]